MPIRVLHTTNIYKSNYYLNNLAENFSPNDVEMMALTFSRSEGFLEDLAKRNVKTFSIPHYSRRKFPEIVRELRSLIKEQRIDIIHAHLFEPTFVSFAAARKSNVKKIFTRHHSDALHKIPNIFKRNVYLGIERWINKTADHIIAPSEMVRDILAEKEKVPVKKLSLIPYGQTTDRFDLITKAKMAEVRAELEMDKNPINLVCNSRLYPQKGHVYLFETLAALIKSGLAAKLYLIGIGDYKKELEGLIRSFGIQESVIFLGWRDDALTIMANADVIVHPSLEDALSSAVIESIMLERPIVATDISGVRDTLNNGNYGKIVPPADSTSFRVALEDTLNNLDEARSKAKEGKKYLLEYMNSKRVSDSYLNCYRKLVENL